jgi:hypothetical protein
MQTLSLKVDTNLARRLAAAAKRQGLSRSELIRRAVEAYLAGDGPGGSRSALDLAGDLVGCFKGPSDLSTNPDHLADVGR